MNVSATGDFFEKYFGKKHQKYFSSRACWEVLVLRVNNERRIEQSRSKGWILK